MDRVADNQQFITQLHVALLPQDQEFELYEYAVSPEEAAAAEKEEDTSVD